ADPTRRDAFHEQPRNEAAWLLRDHIISRIEDKGPTTQLTAVAFALYGRALSGSPGASQCCGAQRPSESHPAAIGGRARRALELCEQKDEPALGLDCHGCYDAPSPRLPCRGPEPGQR